MAKILHVIGSLDPADGGPPKIASCLAAAQAGDGHDVRLLFCATDGQVDAENPMLESIPDIGRVELLTTARPGYRRVLGLSRPAEEVRRSVDWCEVAHLHSVWDPILPVTAREARRSRRPYLVLLNGMLDPWSMSQSRWKKTAAMHAVYRKMLNGARTLHVGNADEENLIDRLGLDTSATIIPNGVFPEEFEDLPPDGEFRSSVPELGDDPFVLFLSRLHYKKGLDVLADAFAYLLGRCPSVRMVVAGPDDGYRGEFIRRVAQLGLGGRVHLTGPLYGRAKYAALVDATCFCLPSRQEGFSVAITEALAVGCVPVITKGCHFPEVASEDAGWVVELSADEVGEALMQAVRPGASR